MWRYEYLWSQKTIAIKQKFYFYEIENILQKVFLFVIIL